MATNSPRGFQRAMGPDKTHRYQVSANNAEAIFPGFLVVLNAGGGIQSWESADASAIASQRGVLGVVKSVLDSNGKPLTHSQPTKGPFLDASTEGYVEVYDHPDTIFMANASASASRNMLGQFAPVSFGANNSAAGIAGWGVDLSNAVASAAGDQILRVIDVAEFDGFPNRIAGGAANNDVYVQIADHHMRRQFRRVGSDS